MPVHSELYHQISNELKEKNVTLVAVSKTKSVAEILELYNLGQKDFGENYVQELAEKYHQLPKDIHWHFIGHLQSNKVKLIAPFVHLIHSVDSEKLLKEINKEAKKNERIIDCLLQVHIAKEETKFGLDENELEQIIQALNLANNTNEEKSFKNISIKGLMGMASFTDDEKIVRHEFHSMKFLFDKFSSALSFQPSAFSILSMGMSADYKIAIEEGSNMVRIGSLLFGERNYTKS
ncbi:YggS family pyridoxal phosphate-dependent enzyme [Hanamia caeni]|uniref:Pyridoxal phosphate homeostasis protein n=1 Tax=Hanamia caeni TaxID=2294116 RepID=A0A3M9N8G2_9BACT|nr:YggS family pyridoxal phosphate-dependent enzyme [Hanamia caeni]RNI34031.1 YggS family pyridoxal phosphate-dependent enzyme [Hanamia caeni]